MEATERKKLAEILRTWFTQSGFKTQTKLAAEISKLHPLDTGSLSRLLNGQENVAVTPHLIRAFADTCKADATPALYAAGFVITDNALPNVPETVLGVLASMEDWELDLLADELPAWRLRVRHQMEILRTRVGIGAMSTASVATETEAVSSNVKEPAAAPEMLSTRGERRETESAQQSDIPSAAEGVHKNVPVLPREVESVDQTIRRRRPPAR